MTTTSPEKELSARLPTSPPALSRRPVTIPTDDHKTIVHPDLGEIELDRQLLLTRNQAQLLLVFTASPGTEGYELNSFPSSAPKASTPAAASDRAR
jgi:hypothetical protein